MQLQTITLLSFACFALACGSDESDEPSDDHSGHAGGATHEPGHAGGETSTETPGETASEGVGAFPDLQQAIANGFLPTPNKGCEQPGFACDVSLDPPASGFQLEVGPFPVPEGKEVLVCYWRKVPHDVVLNEFKIRYNNGSHHMDVFFTDYSEQDALATGQVPDGAGGFKRFENYGGAAEDGFFDCSETNEAAEGEAEGLSEVGGLPTEVNGQPVGSPGIVVGFQNDSVDWKLPDGVGMPLKAGQQLIVQAHFANVGSQKTPTSRLYDLLNFVEAPDPTAIEHFAENVLDEDDDIFLPAGERTTLSRTCDFYVEGNSTTTDNTQPVNLIAYFAHFHSRGERGRAWAVDPTTVVDNTIPTEEPFYTNTNWEEAPFATFEQGLPAMGIRMVNEYFNFTDRDIIWGNFVSENEHMEAFPYFYPAIGFKARCGCYKDGHGPEGAASPGCDGYRASERARELGLLEEEGEEEEGE